MLAAMLMKKSGNISLIRTAATTIQKPSHKNLQMLHKSIAYNFVPREGFRVITVIFQFD